MLVNGNFKIVIFFICSIFLLASFTGLVAGCGLIGSGDDDLYIKGKITGEVISIQSATKDIKIKAYLLEGIGNRGGNTCEVSMCNDNYTYSFWWVVEYGPGGRGKMVYSIMPTVESKVSIPSSVEVIFVPSSKIVTIEETIHDDGSIENIDFDTVLIRH